MIRTMLIAGAGGFAGTCCRFLVQKYMPVGDWVHFPLGTFIVNIAGCLLIGILSGLTERSGLLSERETAFLVTGFCGGLTTFSTFANDSVKLSFSGEALSSVLYVLLSVAVGIGCVVLGKFVIKFCFS